ncbi:hypothetical protein BN938_1756 [Mucinivorans hirudinis]|uniref:Uncharacterized protein n=1 Tax=Mucinivorans hirudinis TaxID=1433126 RepID=A0A060R8K6_9BACT|nr:hypothetical protein BN938_1756 [Mucinivorans hirudinis]
MKEYIAETGGRYTYSDDIVNLQELALGMTALFSECSAFIISGCLSEGGGITPGYVWLGGKVRYFEGAESVALPYYIYEHNNHESVVYANEVNKRGRTCYLCSGTNTVPTVVDAVTGQVPTFIEITADYAPRLIDKFFGRYALLLNTPSSRQRVQKDVQFAGEVVIDKAIKSSKEVAVQNAEGRTAKVKIKDGGEVTLGAYLNELLTAEIIMGTDGSFSFMKGASELAKVDSTGFSCSTIKTTQASISALYLYQTHITNSTDNTDQGSVNINYTGYNQGISRFRNFNIYDGKRCSVPLFSVEGQTRTTTVSGTFKVSSTGACAVIQNNTNGKTEVALTAYLDWRDKDNATIASVGFISNTTHDFTLRNTLGNFVFTPNGYVVIDGELKLKDKDIYSIFVTQTTYTGGMGGKVDKVNGKQLSTEDFTTVYKQKLDSISGSSLDGGGTGFVTAKDVSDALKLKLSANENLRDVADKAVARTNIDVYSKGEGNGRYLQISNKLLELVNLTADEINNLTHEQANALKASKQQAVRDNIDAEKKGTGDLKLAKASNLADLTDKALSRKNISVYSVAEIDAMMGQKLDTGGAYTGAIFTETHKQKLEGIKTGNFAYIDNQGVSQSQTEGYVLVSDVVKELKKFAPRLLDGYNSSDKDAVAANIGVYTKTVADGKFASVEQLFQDYITHLVKSGKTTAQAQQTLRDKLDVLSKTDVSGTYLTKDGKLSDLNIPNADAKKLACRNIGAAYADDYQTKLIDTGWIQMNNSGIATDTRALFIRQIGNIVSIQGIVNTAKRDGGNMGGVVAVIPNQIQPPRYGLRCTHADFNDDHKFNRGAWFKIFGGSRTINIYESGYYNVSTEINFTYFV